VQARALDRPVVVVGVSEPDLGPLLCRLLREAAYDTTLATDGVAVVTAVVRAAPDLLLVDLDLERLDGLLTLEIVRVISEDLPVVLLSAVVSAAIQQKARHLGAVAILRKPFQNSELLDALARACRAENEAKGA